jgi:hypothetical protein
MTQPATTRGAAPQSGWVKTGAAALEALSQAQKDNEDKRSKGYMPLRMFVPRNQEIEVIILDEAFVSDEPGVGGALIREHNLKDSNGKWTHHESCCIDFANCALCDKAGADGFGPSTHVVMLTALVLKPWTNKKTGENHAYSRMLLPIKLGQKERYLELQKHAMREQGSMRGLYMVLRRGDGDQSVATGEPIMLDNGKLYDLIGEDELLKDYGHPPVKNREGKVIKPANGDLEPFNYAELFPRPDPDDLSKRFGVRQQGSRRSVAESWDEEQAPAAAAAEAAPARRRGAATAAAPVEAAPVPARRRGAAPAGVSPNADSAYTDEPVEVKVDQTAQPARRRGGAAKAEPLDGAKDPW